MEENTKKPLTLSGTLGLKKPLSGSQIRQTVGGQSKFVQVEVRKKRTIGGSTSPTTSVLSDAAQAQKLKLLMEAKKLEEVKAKKRAEEEAQRAKEREEMKRQEKSGLVLTCKEELLPFYQRFGFVSEGISDSVHGGAVWYQMRLDFEQELSRCARTGGECSFYQNGRRYLLYGWRQCDGDYLNVSDETGQMIWQTAKSGQAACDDFMAAYRCQALY